MGMFTVNGNWLIGERMVEAVPVELPEKFSPQEHPEKDAKLCFKVYKNEGTSNNNSASRKQFIFVKTKGESLILRGYFNLARSFFICQYY